MAVRSVRVAVLLCLVGLVGAGAVATATPAAAVPTWDGGRVECRTDEQVRLVIEYRGVLHLRWGENGGMNHRAGPYFSPTSKPFTYDTGTPVVVWRAEAKADNNGIPGNINSAYATCV